MGDGDSGYQIGSGIGEEEVARPEVQGAALAPATRMILAEAGIRPGMRVLDLGCGAGDVTFVAGDLVGSGGSVVGIDRSPEALARAPGGGADRAGAGQAAASCSVAPVRIHTSARSAPVAWPMIVLRLTS